MERNDLFLRLNDNSAPKECFKHKLFRVRRSFQGDGSVGEEPGSKVELATVCKKNCRGKHENLIDK